jgi:phospholipid transport system substrate-binding protein
MLGALFLVLTLSLPVHADPASEPASIVDRFHAVLLSVMKEAGTLGYQGRYTTLEPAIDQTFDLPVMTRIVTGAHWNDWSADERERMVAAFRRFVISTYARRFDGYSGESFQTEETKSGAAGSLVKTELIRPADPPIALNYLLRDDGQGQFRVVDVFLTGTISELATRRSEFGAILEHDGYDGLLKALAAKSVAKLP